MEADLKAIASLSAACRIAQDSLPRLDQEDADELRPHVDALCEMTDRILAKYQPPRRSHELPAARTA